MIYIGFGRLEDFGRNASFGGNESAEMDLLTVSTQQGRACGVEVGIMAENPMRIAQKTANKTKPGAAWVR
jgi:hypothetical protein